MGWYLDSVKDGNQLILNGSNLSIKESGWFQVGLRVGEMKTDTIKYRHFTRTDVFQDTYWFAQDKITSIFTDYIPK